MIFLAFPARFVSWGGGAVASVLSADSGCFFAATLRPPRLDKHRPGRKSETNFLAARIGQLQSRAGPSPPPAQLSPMTAFRVFGALFLGVLLAAATASAQPPAAEPAPVTRTAEPGYFGVLATNAANGEGALLAEIVAGSPAAAAGLQTGDVISAVADTPIHNARELIEVLSAYASGETVTLGVRQSGFLKDVEVTLGQRPAPPRRRFSDFGRVATMPSRSPQQIWIAPDTLLEDRTPADQRLGIHTVPATSAALKRRRLPDRPGALVMRIERDSPADLAGIPVGALITSVDNVAVHSPQSLATAMNETAGAIELKYCIGDEERTCRVQRDDGNRP